MPQQQVQFLGPTLHPIRKWAFVLSILGFLASLLAFGLLRGLPLWLQNLGWAFIGVLYCFSNLAWWPKDRR
jgi:hypothetical protein